jgi:hypothetical protein
MRSLLLFSALTLLAATARADDLLYVGAGISRDKLADIRSNGFGFKDLDNTSWKALVGLRPVSFLGAEVDYIDLGSQTTNFIDVSAHSKYHAFSGYAVGYLPVPVPYLDLFVKAGAARWSSSGSGSSVDGPFSLSRDGTSFAWGAGGQVRFGNLGARLEYENFNVPNTNGAQVISLDVMLHFM